MEKTTSPYDWNWAEQAEHSAERVAQRSLLLERWPDLPTYVSAMSMDFSQPTTRPNLEDTTPVGYDELPPRLGFLACCMLNPNGTHGLAWMRWALEDMEELSRAKTTLTAMDQIRLNHGPLSLLAPGIILETLRITEIDSKSKTWRHQALVNLFQPQDVGMDLAEDAFYAPACRTLLDEGALPNFRDTQGNSALSGLNHMLTESEISMAAPAKIADLMHCAEMLLDSGANPEMVRPLPPLESLVSHDHLRWMLLSHIEKNALSLFDASSTIPPSTKVPRKQNTRL